MKRRAERLARTRAIKLWISSLLCLIKPRVEICIQTLDHYVLDVLFKPYWLLLLRFRDLQHVWRILFQQAVVYFLGNHCSEWWLIRGVQVSAFGHQALVNYVHLLISRVYRLLFSFRFLALIIRDNLLFRDYRWVQGTLSLLRGSVF